jgi:hypothetical protein
MKNSSTSETPGEGWTVRAVIRLCAVTLLITIAVIPTTSRAQAQQPSKPPGSEPFPEPAAAAILAAFDKYEVVAMPEAHGMKDIDDFILLLLRNPAFPDKVNDIAVECGNSLYQPILDRYIAGEDVPFKEVRKVWRNTTQPMCGASGFFEQLFPLVRAINQKLPTGKRLRMLAGDSPVEWDKVTSMQDAPRKFFDREASIASVMKNEVLSKHRKALMLFGTFHLMHGATRGAVGAYEKDYPNVTFVISDLLDFDANLPGVPRNPFAAWPVPSLATARGTWVGALDIGHFFPPLIMFDKDCNVVNGFPKDVQKPMAELVDAFLYLGPPELALTEQMPADIALDADYRKEVLRRVALAGPPGMPAMTKEERDEEIVKSAEHPLFEMPPPPDTKAITQSCLDRKKQASPPK